MKRKKSVCSNPCVFTQALYRLCIVENGNKNIQNNLNLILTTSSKIAVPDDENWLKSNESMKKNHTKEAKINYTPKNEKKKNNCSAQVKKIKCPKLYLHTQTTEFALSHAVWACACVRVEHCPSLISEQCVCFFFFLFSKLEIFAIQIYI